MISALLVLALAQVGPNPSPSAQPVIPVPVPAPSAEAPAAADHAPSHSASDEALYRECVGLVASDPTRAVEVANDWRIRGGGIFARQCLALAYAALERWEPAAVAFEQAAREAESTQDPRRADFWVQSGNAWLASGDGAKARTAFDAALATTLLTPALRGEVHLDRARAGTALGDMAGARADVDKGLALVPADPFGWYMSARLAARENDLSRARADIARAVEIAPDDADLLLLAGDIAQLSGDAASARGFYTRIVNAVPDTEAGEAAQAALAELSSPAAAPPDQSR